MIVNESTYLRAPNAVSTSLNKSKADPSRRVPIALSEGFEGAEEAAPKSWFRAAGGIGLWGSKPRWLWMIGGDRMVATDVGKRAEAGEGLYLGCGLRYSLRKMGCW